jgi:hypothetical protein
MRSSVPKTCPQSWSGDDAQATSSQFPGIFRSIGRDSTVDPLRCKEVLRAAGQHAYLQGFLPVADDLPRYPTATGRCSAVLV